MQFQHITTDEQLCDWCQRVAGEAVLAIDTEFVSEDTYRPDLSLIQVAADGELAIIDPRSVKDLVPFWERLADGGHQTVVHAGREEFLFCLRAIGKRPARWFDAQVAAGMAGLEYPASYANLVTRILGKTVPKGETRTDSRRRPLSSRQLEYALHDVAYLDGLREHLQGELERLGRTAWLDDELVAWQDDLQRDEQIERWRRVSGISGLSNRSLAVVRELWRWREAEAEALNLPPRRVLRDDLLTEFARRGTADMSRIRALRGLQRRNLKKLPQIGAVRGPRSAAAALRTAAEGPRPEPVAGQRSQPVSGDGPGLYLPWTEDRPRIGRYRAGRA